MPTSTSTSTAPTTDSVTRLLPAMAETFEVLLLESDAPTTALGIRLVDGEVELSLRTVEHHPVDDLLGFTAPSEWDAFGIAARGRSSDGDAVRLVHLVARDGSSWWHLSREGAPPLTSEEQPAGLVDDLCRRVLGLPTPPPAASALDYWAARWLADVLDLAHDGATPPTWAAVAACHHAVSSISSLQPELGPTAADQLVVAGRALDRAYPWAALRSSWSTDGALGLSGPEIAWMDDGMLSRWCLATQPELTDLVDAVGSLLAPAIGERVRETLTAWGLVW